MARIGYEIMNIGAPSAILSRGITIVMKKIALSAKGPCVSPMLAS
jgi:hypothetical protein